MLKNSHRITFAYVQMQCYFYLPPALAFPAPSLLAAFIAYNQWGRRKTVDMDRFSGVHDGVSLYREESQPICYWSILVWYWLVLNSALIVWHEYFSILFFHYVNYFFFNLFFNQDAVFLLHINLINMVQILDSLIA